MASEPTSLDAFYRKHPEFIACPIAIGLLLLAAWHSPAGAAASRSGMEPWGSAAVWYVMFSVLFQFAFHGWVCTFFEDALQNHKMQPIKPSCAALASRRGPGWLFGPANVATRQTATLLSNLLYMLVPLRPASSSWCSFVASLLALSLLWDAYFFVVHRAFHRSGRLYTLFHKLHHRVKEPMVFTAYYVTYQSHFLTEQLVVLLACSGFVPRDAFVFYMYYALFDTFAQHAGVELDHLRVPLAPRLTLGHVRRLLSLYGAPFGAYGTAHHDWHHERSSKNYALAFTYLDRLCGTYFDGRKPAGQVACLAAFAPREVKTTKGLCAINRHKSL